MTDTEQVSVHSDARGFVFEPVDGDDLVGKQNVHVVLTHPGGIRGNHYHEHSAEVVVVTGESLVRLHRGDDTLDVTVPEGEAYRFRLPPGTAHAFKNTGTTDTLLVAFATEPHDPDNPDAVRCTVIS